MDILKKNFRNKFIVLTLCFTLFFTSLNYKKIYADAGIISAPMLATVVTLALGTGIVLKGADDIYDLGRCFYEYHKNQWDTVNTLFNSTVAFNKALNKITVGNEFRDNVQSFLDDTFVSEGDIIFNKDLGIYNMSGYVPYTSIPGKSIEFAKTYSVGDVVTLSGSLSLEYVSSRKFYGDYYNKFNLIKDGQTLGQFELLENIGSVKFYYNLMNSTIFYSNLYGAGLDTGVRYSSSSSISIPYGGGYEWPQEWDNDNDLPLWVPGDLGSVVGGNPSDVTGDSAPPWVGNGDVSIPNVDNPSIGVVDGSFPQTDTDVVNPPSDIPGVENPPSDIPGEGIWATIKDFIIGLVVPSDTFWTDTWNGLYNNFVSCFPGVDMSNFNSLVTGEKKFPNIDINIMNVKGRVVNGDVINSIVDWLRPIIAGFMMLCLMFFNYRKIYKLIRNSEPFGGIALGTSDFSTGISEYSDNYIKAKEIIGDTMRSMTTKGGR